MKESRDKKIIYSDKLYQQKKNTEINQTYRIITNKLPEQQNLANVFSVEKKN